MNLAFQKVPRKTIIQIQNVKEIVCVPTVRQRSYKYYDYKEETCIPNAEEKIVDINIKRETLLKFIEQGKRKRKTKSKNILNLHLIAFQISLEESEQKDINKSLQLKNQRMN